VSTTDLADATSASAEDRIGTSRALVARAADLRPAWKGLVAYLIYQALAFRVWVVPILPSFGENHLGNATQDSNFYQWSLSWTPWAIAHGLDPLSSKLLFAPAGLNLAWTAFVPGPALVTSSITAVFGPLASRNLLLAVAPALAAWAAYLVCHRLTHAFWASLAGGCLFGFSAYMATNMDGYINLVLIFPIPLLVYLVVRSVEGSLGRVAFVVAFAAALIGLFSISTELFGTAALLGSLAYGGALLFGSELRRALLRTGALILIAGGIAALVLAPYVWAVVEHAPADAVRQPELARADLRAFIVPPPVTAVGEHVTISPVTESVRGNGERYLGLASVAVLVGFAITERRRRSTWLLLAFVVVVSAVALGPTLRVGAALVRWLPGRLLARAPLLSSVAPPRLTVYSLLVLAVIASLWLARARGRWAWIRWAIVLAAVVTSFPGGLANPDQRPTPAFFSSVQMHDVIHPDEIVYAIPYTKGDEMRWQAASGFWFRLAEGFVGPLPPELDTGPIAHGLHVSTVSYLPTSYEFATWIGEHGVTAVLLEDAAEKRYGDLLASAGLVRVSEGDGISVWRPATSAAPPGLG
jgi:hypothetical protein